MDNQEKEGPVIEVEAELVGEDSTTPVSKKLTPLDRFQSLVQRDWDRFIRKQSETNEVIINLTQKLAERYETALHDLTVEVDNHKTAMESLKSQMKSVGLPKSEQVLYEAFAAWTDYEEPLKLLWILVNAEHVESGGWLVPSSREAAGPYYLPEDLSECPCKSFHIHRDCKHLKAIRLRTRIEWYKATKFVTPA